MVVGIAELSKRGTFNAVDGIVVENAILRLLAVEDAYNLHKVLVYQME